VQDTAEKQIPVDNQLKRKFSQKITSEQPGLNPNKSKCIGKKSSFLPFLASFGAYFMHVVLIGLLWEDRILDKFFGYFLQIWYEVSFYLKFGYLYAFISWRQEEVFTGFWTLFNRFLGLN
jgi:hypothetical protein